MGSSKQLDTGVWETIFASPVVVGAARVVILSAAVVLLFGGLYLAISILYRMRHGQWLRRAGPFEAHLAEEGEAGLEEESAALIEGLTEVSRENELLIAELGERDRQLRELESR
jgi:hypothetical protein